MSTIKHSQISALLVDDDAKLCGLLRDYLEGFGFSLDVAEDASSGLEKAVANEYDVILLDMMLPDMDGLDVLRRLREIGSTPIVIFSAQDEEASGLWGLRWARTTMCPKPFPRASCWRGCGPCSGGRSRAGGAEGARRGRRGPGARIVDGPPSP